MRGKGKEAGTASARGRSGRWLGAVIGVVVLTLAGFFFIRFASPAVVRDLTVQRLSALTDREVEIAGDFDYVLSLTPRVEAQQLTIANADWGTRSAMLTAENVAVELEILPLLMDGELRIARLVLERAEVLVERGPEGQLNWQFDTAEDQADASSASGEGGGLAVDALTIRDSTIVWRQRDGDQMAAGIERLAWQADPANGALAIEARGRYADNAFTARGTLGTLTALTRADTPSPVDLDVSFGTARLLADGTIAFPLGESATELALVISGEDEAALQGLLARDLPPLGGWRLAVAVSSAEGALQATQVTGHVAGPEGLRFTVADGTVGDLLAGSRVVLPTTVEAPSLAGVEVVTGSALPALGAFHAEGRLTGKVEALRLENASGWLGPQQSQPLLQVTGGGIGDVLAGSDIDLQLRAPGGGAEALAGLLGRPLAYDSLNAEARLTGSLDRLALQDLNADAAHGGTRLGVAGSIGALRALSALDLRIEAEGPSLAGFGPLLGTTLPETPPLALAGRVTGGGGSFAVEDLSGTVAETEAQGRLEVALPDSAVPQVEGELSFTKLDLGTFLPGRRDGIEAGTAAAAESLSLDLPVLQAFEAVLAVRAGAVVVQGRRFTDATTTLRLQDGRLAVQDLTARAAGGVVAADAALDAAEGPAAEVVLRLQAEEVSVGQLIGGTPGRVTGQLDIDLNVDATGRTLDELAANLEGDAALFGEEGELQDVPLNRMIPDLDITRILPIFWRRDSTVRVNCVIGEFDIDDGVARTETMLDTQRMTLLGSGAVDLGQRVLDLSLRPVAKSRKLSTSSVPVDIEGSFSDPQISPRVGAAAGGALRGFLGGLLVPLNQITALFGNEAKDACSEALRRARGRRGADEGAEN